MAVERSFITRRDIADELQVNIRTVDRWIASGDLKALRTGRTTRIRRTDFERFVTSRTRETAVAS